MKFTLALAAASVGFAGIAAPAFAGDTIRKTQSVSYKGLDLNTAEGQGMTAVHYCILPRSTIHQMTEKMDCNMAP